MIKISQPLIYQEEKKAALAVLNSGRLAQGPQVARLEKKFAKLCGTKYAVATCSGTAALHTTLYALGLGPGDEMITTPFSFIATANAILMVGARPVFVDIDPKTFNINPEKIKKAITRQTRAILAVNLYGQPADYKKINKIAKKYKLFVIEDAAQSINASLGGRKSGNLGESSCFSLYATKNITSGEGGLITTHNKNYYKRARLFRNHGQKENIPYQYQDLGFNYRMTEIQAALALEQLKKLNKITKRRQAIAKRYNQAFKKVKGLLVPYQAPDRTHVYHQYTLRITKEFKRSRDGLKKYLEKKGIEVKIYYPKPLHLYPHFQKFGYKKGDFPVAEKASQAVLSIPVHPLLREKEINYIIKTITKI